MLLISILSLLISNAVTLRRDISILFNRVAIIALIYAILHSSIGLFLLNKGIGLHGGLLNVTNLTQVFDIFIFLISILILQLTSFFPRKVWIPEHTSFAQLLLNNFVFYRTKIINKMGEHLRIIEYPKRIIIILGALILLFIISGAVFLISTSDLVSVFLAIELQSYGLYLLSTIYRNSELSTTGGLMYFLLGGLSSCFILLGSSLLYANSGTTSLDGLYAITSIGDNLDYWYKPYYINFSFLVFTIGFLFKVSAAPFHFWSPDVYDAIPTIVTTFVAIIAKISIFVFFLEIVFYTKNYFSEFNWTYGLLISSLLSLVIGTTVGLTQFRIKRLFAYSTISHVGFILLALSISSVESSQAFIFYLMQYSISNLNAFIILIAIGFSLYYYISDNKEYKELLDNNNSPASRYGKPLFRDLWSNSKEYLKLKVPSYILNTVYRWVNYSWMVTSLSTFLNVGLVVLLNKIIERTMVNRGSKSALNTLNAVKEQRVDGHSCVRLNSLQLRYTLMGFERSYQTRILSNHFNFYKNSSCFSTCQVKNKLNPWYITGFSDGESNFRVGISQSNSKLGWIVQPVFQIELHKKDLNLLKKIKAYFDVGEIYFKESSCNFKVQSLKGVKVIINHFEKYPLFTKKREDFLLFTQIVVLISQKEHLTNEGLQKIISLKASMNLGLPKTLKIAFPNLVPAVRPKRSDVEIANSKLDPHWVVGFSDAEGCFSIRVTKPSTVKTGYQVQLRYQITQHSIDKIFMNSLVKFWDCGKVFFRYKESKVDFQILKISDISYKVVPLFLNIPLESEKYKDFLDFCKAVDIMKTKDHLTNKGLDEIRRLKEGMNRGRDR
uniref:NADH dehydrogenase subunit 2 n=1 Tax=Raffaelea arxii TaxID=45342 RepID=UPI00292A3C52|nr:NADH dehydrogenase subunit 2 [Raffaelea arxii]WNK75974.1 NADH dehydrogenase subunit 2 [Raffaelea arxii]